MPQIAQLSMVFASQLFWLVISFGLIFFIVGRGMLPKVRSTITARTEKITDDAGAAVAGPLVETHRALQGLGGVERDARAAAPTQLVFNCER